MDLDMILHAEHGSNASAFTARVTVGTEANLHAAMTAAIAPCPARRMAARPRT
jgi:citrate synthase